MFLSLTSLAPATVVYIGSGCFWARQHLVTIFEQQQLGRQPAELTGVAGYAGSAGTGKVACYENSRNFSEYSALGHAEAVQVDIPDDKAEALFSTWFNSFVALTPTIYARPDFQDVGPAYRSLVGLPGGMQSPLMASLRAANVHNMTLLVGGGSDPDTLGLGQVYVMDSEKYPFIQAEVCLQYHDDATAKYPEDYHKLRDVALSSGRIQHSQCPPNLVCNVTVLV
mmetsp:Transcript_57292/g.125504  ORF Transcript_57292/g.125504 Transcript_57292/m.125504 type:complete len:225 (-) Transcript_57292:65-739(-)|eukprot:CAMPEP_0204271870 /NCGR_PEP_ID=MMETSP0468-20130131/21325_1 /ASSEMBLY_ACC=CAM_ASM_000383 /TAXON_ID=2969 /ORGANISM="Oxyrrhis marina" /LENGTH=224 /DNA_ID=CAMNT_0051247639 /DNA_START=36 /DNA_END=710 /DNA_ORIENTATION=+